MHGLDGLPQPTPAPAIARDAVWFTMCAWCERIRIRGHWLEQDRARPYLPADEAGTGMQLTHGICAECLDVVSAPSTAAVQRR